MSLYWQEYFLVQNLFENLKSNSCFCLFWIGGTCFFVHWILFCSKIAAIQLESCVRFSRDNWHTVLHSLISLLAKIGNFAFCADFGCFDVLLVFVLLVVVFCVFCVVFCAWRVFVPLVSSSASLFSFGDGTTWGFVRPFAAVFSLFCLWFVVLWLFCVGAVVLLRLFSQFFCVLFLLLLLFCWCFCVCGVACFCVSFVVLFSGLFSFCGWLLFCFCFFVLFFLFLVMVWPGVSLFGCFCCSGVFFCLRGSCIFVPVFLFLFLQKTSRIFLLAVLFFLWFFNLLGGYVPSNLVVCFVPRTLGLFLLVRLLFVFLVGIFPRCLLLLLLVCFVRLVAGSCLMLLFVLFRLVLFVLLIGVRVLGFLFCSFLWLVSNKFFCFGSGSVVPLVCGGFLSLAGGHPLPPGPPLFRMGGCIRLRVCPPPLLLFPRFCFRSPLVGCLGILLLCVLWWWLFLFSLVFWCLLLLLEWLLRLRLWLFSLLLVGYGLKW